MTRKELIQSPIYWKELYENECWNLGIKPTLEIHEPLSEEYIKKILSENPEGSFEDGLRMGSQINSREAFIEYACDLFTDILEEVLDPNKSDIPLLRKFREGLENYGKNEY